MNSAISSILEGCLCFLVPAVLIAAVWGAISLIIAQSGWSKLATLYPASGRPTGELYWARSFLNCRNMVEVIVAPHGLHISHTLPMLKCRPMYVPWSAVKDCGLWKELFLTHVEISITTGTELFLLTLPAKARPAIEKYASVAT
jgi:hypothetical protein